MNRRYFLRNISIGTIGLSMGTFPLQSVANPNSVTLTILHTNDMHCHIEPFSNGKFKGRGGLAKISELTKKIKAQNKNSLLFDSGDMFQGTPYFNYFKGELMLKVMSLAGYDAGTIGNHEFDNGLEGILNQLPNAKFPIINSNYDFSNTILAGKFKAWKIFKRAGLKIGVYGLGIELQGLVIKDKYGETVYNDPIKVAQETESFLKNEKHCDLVICLSHLGYKYKDATVSDCVLANETHSTDIILGGHSHTFLPEPVILKNKNGSPVLISQEGWGGLALGKIELVFERAKKQQKAFSAQKINV